jgi:hypothetical protein
MPNMVKMNLIINRDNLNQTKENSDSKLQECLTHTIWQAQREHNKLKFFDNHTNQFN